MPALSPSNSANNFQNTSLASIPTFSRPRPPLGTDSDDDPLSTCLGNRIARCDGARTHPVTALSYILSVSDRRYEQRSVNSSVAMGAAPSGGGQPAASVSPGQLRGLRRHSLQRCDGSQH